MSQPGLPKIEVETTDPKEVRSRGFSLRSACCASQSGHLTDPAPQEGVQMGSRMPHNLPSRSPCLVDSSPVQGCPCSQGRGSWPQQAPWSSAHLLFHTQAARDHPS